jgi:glutamine synthetase
MSDDTTKAVRFIWIDNNGIARAKAVTRAHLADRLTEGVGVAVCRQAANLLDRVQPLPGYGEIGEVRTIPDPSTFFRLPHAPGAAGMLCDLLDSQGRPWDACPRSFLKRMVARADELDLSILGAFEPEFSLCRLPLEPGRFRPADDSLCFDMKGFDDTHAFAMALIEALSKAGLEPEIFHPEFSAGQHEFTFAATPALRSADEFAIYRTIVRGLAESFGFWATFAAAPSPDVRGNGCHLHLSAWRNGENLFADGGGGPLSPLGMSFLAGLLDHAAGLVAVTCPGVNSYARLRPGAWAGARLRSGVDDREAVVRIPGRPAGTPPGRANIEFRACDGTVNPYLALGCVLAAGLDGVRRSASPADSPNRSAPDLPSDLSAALDALEADSLLMDSLGPELAKTYVAVKRSDIADLSELNREQVENLYIRRF